MSEFHIKVETTRPQRKLKGRLRQLARRGIAALGRASRHPVVVAAAGTGAFLLIAGTPHVGWDYACRHATPMGAPCRSAVYCAYYGIQGRRVVFPEPGQRCHLVVLLRPDFKQMMGD